MLGVLEQLGYDLDGPLTSAGLLRSDLEDSDAYVSPSVCALVFARVRQQRRVPNLALHLALRTPIGTNPLLDYLIFASSIRPFVSLSTTPATPPSWWSTAAATPSARSSPSR
jgi:hypothetical protein